MPITRPVNLQKPFADSGAKNTIPVASQIGIVNGAASYTDGFPPLTMTPIAAGGIPPAGQDFNGILNALSAHTTFQNAGGKYRFDSALSTAIGGYPAGFVLQDDAGVNEYVNILAGNTTNFNSTPASIGVSWIPYSGQAATQSSASIVASAAGTADAITATYTPVVLSLTNGLVLYVRAGFANATTTPTFSPNGLTAKTIVKGNGLALVAGDIAGAGHWVELQYDLALDKWVLLNPATGVSASAQTQIPVRQTVISGPVDTNGFPTFLPATSASFSITTQNVSTGANALVATAAGGAAANGAINAVAQSTSNLTWSGCTASATNFLPLLVSGGTLTPQTPVTLAPIYQWGGTPAVTAGQYTYNIQQGIMYLGNGSVANAVNHVIVGEVVAGASTITSSIAYAYQGRYSSGRFAISNTTAYVKSHNLGTAPEYFKARAQGASVASGALSDFSNIYVAPNYYGAYFEVASRTSVTLNTGTPTQIYSGTNNAAAAVEAIITLDRGWN